MANKIIFKGYNSKHFSDWLKKYTTIERKSSVISLLLEIDAESEEFVAKSYNEERSIVKYSKTSMLDAGLELTSDNGIKKRIKLGIYDIKKMIKMLDQFENNEFMFTVNYDETYESEDEKELTGTSINIKNDSLKINIDCISLNLFKYISDDLFINVISLIEDKITSFQIIPETIDKINSLCALDKDYKYISFKASDNIYAAGESFQLMIKSLDSAIETINTIDIFKDQFDSIDKEEYDVEMGEDRLVFKSKDTNTITVVSMVEKDD